MTKPDACQTAGHDHGVDREVAIDDPVELEAEPAEVVHRSFSTPVVGLRIQRQTVPVTTNDTAIG